MKKSYFLSILFLLSLSLFSCDGGKREFLGHQEKWDALQDEDYSFDLSISCFCIQSSYGPVTVVVKGDTVNALLNVNTGLDLIDETDSTLVFAKWKNLYPSIDGLFEVVESAIDDNADKLEVSYDETFGYPNSIDIDWYKNAVDDEIGYTVISLSLD